MFIIQYSEKTNGKFGKLFHEKISMNKSTQTMNLYVEHLTAKKEKALRFFEREEAEKIAAIFTIVTYKVPTIIEVRK